MGTVLRGGSPCSETRTATQVPVSSTIALVKSSFLCEPRRAPAELVNLLRRLSLREAFIEFFARLPAQMFPDRSAAHPSSARRRSSTRRDPLQRRLVCILCVALVPHGANSPQNTRQFLNGEGEDYVVAAHRTDAAAAHRFASIWRAVVYELKLDGYRTIAFKRNGVIQLRSRNDNDFNGRYPAVVEALAKLPDKTVIEGEHSKCDCLSR